MPGQISVSFEAEIATVTISQPGKRNALTVDMWGELKTTFDIPAYCCLHAGYSLQHATRDLRRFHAAL